jgi:translation initiation factor IF-2
MFDHLGNQVKQAGPSSAVRVIGWSGTPECGAIVAEAKNEREAKRTAEEAEFEERKKAGAAPAAGPVGTIETIFEAIAAQKHKTLRLVVKGDVFGSVEAVVTALQTIRSDKVAVDIIDSDVGQISKNDVLVASAGEASIVGFNVKLETGVEALAKHHGVAIHRYSIIYELVDNVRDLMAGMLDPETREIKIGVAEVRAVFPVARGSVAGCLVTEGRVQVNALARVRRGNKVEAETRILEIRRVKDVVKEVRAGTECGIHLVNYSAFQTGDLIECFETEQVRPSL